MNPEQPALPFIGKVIYKGNLLWAGIFRCHPWYPFFEDTGPAQGHLLVFPRTSVCITHAGGDPIVADPNVVMFYNDQQLYRRSKLSERGDLCEWFAFRPHLIIDALKAYDPAVVERPDNPFHLSYGPGAPQTYLRQRLVVRHLLEATPPDPLYVEETMLQVLEMALQNTYQARSLRSQPVRQATRHAHRELTRSAQIILATRFQEPLALADLAAELHCSPYHLCRIFRRQTGQTLHQYLDQLRLRTALEHIDQGHNNLTALALELGYAHHSHFSQAFRQAFGRPPSAWRSLKPREMSKILIA